MSTTDAVQNVAETIESCFQSANVSDSNGEQANVVDVINRLASAGFRIAEAIADLAAAVRERKQP